MIEGRSCSPPNQTEPVANSEDKLPHQNRRDKLICDFFLIPSNFSELKPASPNANELASTPSKPE